MTVQELITQLERFDPTALVEIAVKQDNQRYPVAYSPIFDYGFMQSGTGQDMKTLRINAWLPELMYTVQRKAK